MTETRKPEHDKQHTNPNQGQAGVKPAEKPVAQVTTTGLGKPAEAAVVGTPGQPVKPTEPTKK